MLLCFLFFIIKKGKHFRNICLHIIYLITVYGARLFHMSGVDSLDRKLPAVLDVYMTSLWLLSRTRRWRPQLNLVFFDLPPDTRFMSCEVFAPCGNVKEQSTRGCCASSSLRMFFCTLSPKVVLVYCRTLFDLQEGINEVHVHQGKGMSSGLSEVQFF